MPRLKYLLQEIIRGQRPSIEAQSQFVINWNLSDDSFETENIPKVNTHSYILCNLLFFSGINDVKMNCVVPGCESHSRIQSHRFPKDVKAGEQWLKVINPMYYTVYVL